MPNLAPFISSLGHDIVSSFSVDVVGVFTQEYKQVFSKARSIKATVKETAELMKHPLENGASSVDHRIILPTEIELSLILQAEDYRDAYQQIKQVWLKGDLLLVQTKTDVYTNQLIAELPHEEDPNLYDAIAIALKLKETQFSSTTVTFVPKANKNKSTVNRGDLQPKKASANDADKSSVLFRLFS